MAEFFLDTNVLLYAVSTDPTEAAKSAVARQLLQENVWAWSAQIAAEFIRAGTSRKKPNPLTREEARAWVKTWMNFPMAVVDGSLVLEASTLSERYQISHFDAQVLVAAKRLGCSTVYSEDLNDGQLYDGVQVVNPFAAARQSGVSS